MLRRLVYLLFVLPIFLKANVLAVDYADLPRAPQGNFPIHIPEYKGVKALLPLSSRWIIVVTENIEEIVAELDKLTDGEYSKVTARWEDTEKTDNPDTEARDRANELRELYMAQARNNAGERELDSAGFFNIFSSSDPNYTSPINPQRTTRWIASLGGRRVSGGPDVHFAQYNYLELPHNLQDGNRYTVQVGNGKEVNFLYDEKRTVSRAIKVNQVGYLPDAKEKFAYVSAYLQDFGPLELPKNTRFKVYNADTGQEVLSGDVTLRAANPPVLTQGIRVKPVQHPELLYGENVYEIDLSGLKGEGNFFITIPGVGRSWPFRQAADIYGPVFYTAARGLYHQRCGTPIEKKYTNWPRGGCHQDPVYESDHIQFLPPQSAPPGYSRHDVIAATIDKTRSTEDGTGGWHDSAEWDRKAAQYVCLLDMMGIFEMHPERFVDGQLNIPESGNGCPDLLDEVEYGLKIWGKSMDENGGISGAIDTWDADNIDDPNAYYAFSRRTRIQSLLYAGAAAQYAHLIKPYCKDKANFYEASAKKAYAFGMDPKNKIPRTKIYALRNRGEGPQYSHIWEEDDKDLKPYIVFSKLRLYIMTGDEKYLSDVSVHAKGSPHPYKHPFRYQDYSPWLYYSFFHPKVKDKVPETITAYWKRVFENAAADLWRVKKDQAYRHAMPGFQNYWLSWGNSTMTNRARALFLGHRLTDDNRYLQAGIFNVDFMFGTNPLGMSWTTGLGWVYPVDIHHPIAETDGIPDPIPGITIYGVTEGLFWDLQNLIWQTPKGENETEIFMSKDKWRVPIWRRFFAHPRRNRAQNEFAVHETITSILFTAAELMPDGWMPDDELKNRKPRREDRLFGYYYLP